MNGINKIYRNGSGKINTSTFRKKFHLEATAQGLGLKYVTKGTENYIINGKTIKVEQGQLIIVREAEPFGAFSCKEEETTGWCIDLFSSGVFNTDTFYDNPIIFNQPFDCSASTGIGQLFNNIQTVEQQALLLEKVNDNLLLFNEELSAIQRVLDKKVKKIATQKTLSKSLLASRDFIYKHFRSKITLDDLSKTACLSKFHLLRLFKMCFDKSPKELIHELRMQKALEMIKEQQYSIAAIAFHLGYSSLPAFSVQFKKHFDMPPSAYLKN